MERCDVRGCVNGARELAGGGVNVSRSAWNGCWAEFGSKSHTYARRMAVRITAIITGQIVHAYVEDQFVIHSARGLVDTARLKLIGAMHGAKWYAKLSDRFEMERPTWAGWVRQGKVK